MSRDWKPGDVAVHEGTGEVAFRHKPGRDEWVWMGVGHDGHTFRATDLFGPMRPVVVIDPEDREQVARLAAELHNYDAHLADDPHRESAWVSLAADALRSLITTPKPEEPTGLGAVVEDGDGEVWVRVNVKTGTAEWRSTDDFGRFLRYEALAAVKVLSEGVQA